MVWCLLSFISKPEQPKRIIYEEDNIEELINQEPINEVVDSITIDTIYTYLQKYKIRHKDVVIAQVKLESNHLKSKLYKSNNNPFGMKLAKARPTTAKGSRNGFAYYDSVEDAVIDYAFWQAANANVRSRDIYLNILHNMYCIGDNDYKHKLKKLM